MQQVSALLVSVPPTALISVPIEWFVNVNGFITALTPVRKTSHSHVLQVDGVA